MTFGESCFTRKPERKIVIRMPETTLYYRGICYFVRINKTGLPARLADERRRVHERRLLLLRGRGARRRRAAGGRARPLRGPREAAGAVAPAPRGRRADAARPSRRRRGKSADAAETAQARADEMDDEPVPVARSASSLWERPQLWA